jgi:hypothetical protein
LIISRWINPGQNMKGSVTFDSFQFGLRQKTGIASGQQNRKNETNN